MMKVDSEDTEKLPESDGPATERFGPRNLAIAGASIAAVIVAALLFLVPGDRVLGLESGDSHHERSHDDDGGHGGFDHHRPEGPGENNQGGDAG